MVRAMCGVQLKDRKRAIELTLVLGLSKQCINWSCVEEKVCMSSEWH